MFCLVVLSDPLSNFIFCCCIVCCPFPYVKRLWVLRKALYKTKLLLLLLLWALHCRFPRFVTRFTSKASQSVQRALLPLEQTSHLSCFWSNYWIDYYKTKLQNVCTHKPPFFRDIRIHNPWNLLRNNTLTLYLFYSIWQGSSTFFRPRTPKLMERWSRDPPTIYSGYGKYSDPFKFFTFVSLQPFAIIKKVHFISH